MARLPIGEFNKLGGKRSFAEYLQQQKILDKEIREILRAALADAADSFPTTQIARSQRQALLRGLKLITDGSWEEIHGALDGALNNIAGVAVDTNVDIVSLLSQGQDAQAMLEAAARQAMERVTARQQSRQAISRLVLKNQKLTAVKVNEVINNGLLLGKSAKQIAADVLRYINPNVAGGQSFAAYRLARTELNNAFHAANVKIYEEQPWVEGVKWVTSGSHPRPDICDDFARRDHAGLGPGVFPPDKVPAKPHPQCLCYTIAVTPSRRQFIRNLKNGDYDEWLRKQGFPGILEEGD